MFVTFQCLRCGARHKRWWPNDHVACGLCHGEIIEASRMNPLFLAGIEKAEPEGPASRKNLTMQPKYNEDNRNVK